MSSAPSFDDLFRVMSSASVGDDLARVELASDPRLDDVPGRFAVALNLLLDELAARADRQRRALAEQRAANEALRASLGRNAAIVETALDAIVGADDEGRVEDWNLAAERIFGWSREEALGRPLAELIIPAAHRDAHRAGMRRYRETGVATVLGRRLELTAMRRDGTHFPVELSLAAVAEGSHSSFIGTIRDITERRRAEGALRASEERYRALFEHSPVPMILYDAASLAIADANDAAVASYGYARAALLELSIDAIVVSGDPVETSSDGPPTERHRKRDGAIIDVEARAHQVVIGGREMRLLIAHDVTERRRLEEQLRQAQKMEAVGRLAGGVAHDFNNVLSVILGYSDSIMRSMPLEDPRRAELAEVCSAGMRAAELTRQLLTFSRQQIVERTLIDVNEVIRAMDKMLERAAGVDVRLVWNLAAPLDLVRADRSSIEQVLMNLVVNARDAMPGGGTLTIETARVVLDEAYAHEHFEVRPGPHVLLSVRDSGVGMDKATQARIFEPFFTTKPLGKGTGLGLSVVFGVVRQCGGSIWLYSEPGQGTLFKLYFPCVTAASEPRSAAVAPSRAPGGSETVLLVDDDDQVRKMTHRVLTRAGYEVLEAGNGFDALEVAARHEGHIHLLLSDVIMPRMTGPELAQQLAKVRPDIKVLCISGYTDDVLLDAAPGEVAIAFLQKPVTPQSLKLRVRELLDSPARAAG